MRRDSLRAGLVSLVMDPRSCPPGVPLLRRAVRLVVPAIAGGLVATGAWAQGVAAPDGDLTHAAIVAAARAPVGRAAVAPAFGARVLQAARRYVGVPYRWGGETPRAFDCSGYVRWVFAEAGVAMPRTAREQAGVGDAPYPGELEPGDLLFFWGGRGAQHVAIYAGGDSIIHASTRHKRVRVDRMQGHGFQRNWFGQRLIAVRRVRPATTAAAPPPPGARPTVFGGGSP